MSDPEGRTPPSEPRPAEGRTDAARRRRRGAVGLRGRLVRWLDPEAYALPPAPAPPPASPEGHAAHVPHGGQRPHDLVEGAERFASLRIADVMTPRADIVALEVSTPLDEVLARFVEVELTRLPLYRESLDDPVGVLHIKDVVRLIAPAPDGRGPAWSSPVPKRLRREVIYVPASMRCADLLLRMRVARIHMALVIDEFGGTDGLVTLENLIEAVVGDIGDEHDEERAPEIDDRAGGWEADARAPLEALEAVVGRSLTPEGDEEEEIETVGGLVSALAGRVPQRGEVIVHPAGFEFEVMEADPRRVRRLRIRRAEPAPATGEAGPAAAIDGPPEPPSASPGDGGA